MDKDNLIVRFVSIHYQDVFDPYFHRIEERCEGNDFSPLVPCLPSQPCCASSDSPYCGRLWGIDPIMEKGYPGLSGFGRWKLVQKSVGLGA